MLSINGYVDPTSGKFIQLSPSDITSTRINVTNAEFLSKVKFDNSLIMGSTGISGFDFELPTATTPGIIKTSNPGLNKLNFSNGLGTSDIQLGGIKAPTADNDAANKKYVDDSITTQVSSVYKAKGSITDLTALSIPDKAHEGFVYNIENEFTTTDQFVEGAGKVYSAGTNVVCINTTGTTYKWDVLAGMVNLSDYVTAEDLANGLAGKQEMITTSTNLIAGTITAEAGQYFLKINNQSIDFVDRLISFDHPSISITMSGYKAGSSVTPANVSFLCYPQLTTALQNPYVTLSNIANPTSNYQAANKKYVDDAIAASGGSSITIDSELSGTSTNPVQNKVINSALSNKLDKFTQPAGVQWDGLLYGVQDDGNAHSIQKMFDLCTDAINDTVVLRNNKGEILCETPTNNVTDKHAVNIGYLTTKYGPTNYSSQDKEFYLPSQSNLVIPNAAVGRLFMGPEGARSTDFKLYVSDPIDGGKLIITNLKTPVNDEDATNKSYVDTQVATKQAKFAEYTSTRPSEEAPASDSTNILVLNEGKDFYLRDRATNPLVEFKINSSGALEGTTNYFSLTSKGTFNLKSNTFALSNDEGTPFQVVMDDSKKVVYYGLSGGDDNGSLYLTNTSRTGQQGATLQGNVSSDSRTTALVVNESNTKLLSWKQGTTTNNAPLLGISTPVATADTSKGITADDLDYQAVNKKYVDDIKAELLDAITHPYTYDETTKELTLIL